MNRKILPIFLLLALSVSMFVGLDSTNAAQIPNADHIYTATIGTPETVDPHWAYDTASGGAIQNIYEPLCLFNSTHTDSFLPCVADDWPGLGVNTGNAISPIKPGWNGSSETWLFHIRENMPWQDESYGFVTAADVEYSFERGMLFDHTNGPMWMLYEPLTGLDVSYQWDLDEDGTLNAGEYATLDAVIDNAIQSNPATGQFWFNLVSGYAPFQQILCQTWSMVMCKEWSIDQGLWNGQRNNYTEFIRTWDLPSPGPLMNPAKAMGSGPFTLDFMDEDPNTGYYTHKQFVDYWGGWPADPTLNCTYATVKSVNEWSNRKAQFLSSDASLQADFCVVPRANAPEIHEGGSLANDPLPGIRLIIPPDPSQALDAFYYTYEIAADSPYIPIVGSTPNRFLLKERNFRLACNYLFNFTTYIDDVFLGEATQSPVCMPKGTRYWNETKAMYDVDYAKAQTYIDNLLGGTVKAQGLTMDFVYNIGNTARETACRMMADGLMNHITWGPSAVVDIEAVGIAWANYMPILRAKKLPLFSVGWLADFPDPHNWFTPFMASTGTYASRQVVTYGLEPSTMNWAPNRMYGGALPYTNYNGDTVTAIDNDYVDDLIFTGVGIPDTDPKRNLLYNELMDLYYAEASQLPTVSGLVRHYERTWINGWENTFSENPIAPFHYYYTIYKKTVLTLKDVNVATYTAEYSPESNITKWLLSQSYHTGGSLLSPVPVPVAWMKLNYTPGTTNPIATPTAKVQRTDSQAGAIIVYVTWSGVTASGHREEFGYDYDAFLPQTSGDLGPENVADVAPAVGNYSMWFSTFVLSEFAFNVNVTKDFDSGTFYMLGYCDLNKDNVCDVKDFQQVKKSVGAVQGGTKWRWTADVNNNGAITVSDYQTVKTNVPKIYTPA